MARTRDVVYRAFVMGMVLIAGSVASKTSIAFSQTSWGSMSNSDLEDVQRNIRNMEERITQYKRCIAQERPGQIILYQDAGSGECMAISTQSFREYLKEKGISPSEVQVHLKVWDEMSVEVRRRLEAAIVRMGAELRDLRAKESQLKAQAKQQAAATAPSPPMGLGRRESAGGTAEDYHAALKEVQKTETKIGQLDQKSKDLDRQYALKQKELEEIQVSKGGSIQSIEGGGDLKKQLLKEMAEIEEEKGRVTEEKARLLEKKAQQERRVTASIPKKPWEGRPPADPKDFQTQKDYAFADWKWWDYYAGNQVERDKARADYEKQMTQIAKEEAAKTKGSGQGGTSQMTPIVVTGSGTGSGAQQGSGQSSVPIQPITVVKIPQAGGKETQAEIWDVGKNPPQSLFLTDEEIKAKKAWFKDNPYGFHEIKTQDGKVIDVVANKKVDADTPPVGFITVGEGKEAETTIIQYQEKVVEDSSGTSKTVVSDEAKDKKTYMDGYLAQSNGIVKDVNRGIEWYVVRDVDTSYDQAKAWINALKVGGGGWRMPTALEVWKLYKKGSGTRNMTSFLKTSGWSVWGTTENPYSRCESINFKNGSLNGWGEKGPESLKGFRAFAVRSSR